MRVVFIGASKFGLRCLELLVKHDACELVGVVTAPQQFSISYSINKVSNVLYADIQGYCDNRVIPYVEIQKDIYKLTLLEQLKTWKPDIYIVCGWYHMIPRSWRVLAPAYGLHASLLPDYSGGAPLVWAMINGETKTGITLFQLSDGVDNGLIIAQSETKIYEYDDIASLYGRIENMGLNLLLGSLMQIDKGIIEYKIQNEAYRRTFPQRSPEDGLIDWNNKTRDVWNFIRAQTRPYPGAFTLFKGKKLTIWSGFKNTSDSLPEYKIGEIIIDNKTVCVQCNNGKFKIIEASIDGEILCGAEVSAILRQGKFLG